MLAMNNYSSCSDNDSEMTSLPVAVEAVVASFALDPDSLLELQLPKSSEWSVLFKLGVRVLN